MDLATVLTLEILNGVATLVLISIGLAIIFGMMRVINLAHGEFLMLGGYAAIVATNHGVNIWIAMLVVAPLVVGVISRADPKHPKIPLWEQQLSAGAVCLNLLHAAQAHGFSAQWLTGWYAYDAEAMRWLGLKEGERVAGFVHIGTPQMPPAERDRPELAALVTAWRAEG